MDKFFSRRNMSLVRAYFRLIYIIFATVIIFAAAMLLVENQYINDHLPIIKAKQLANQSLPPSKQFYLTQDEKTMIEYQFHDMLYFMIISITTVGYGDIYPRTVYGQMMCIGIIIVILALIPSQLSEFSKVSNLTTIYSRKHYSNKGKKDAKHILLLGDASPEAIKTFTIYNRKSINQIEINQNQSKMEKFLSRRCRVIQNKWVAPGKTQGSSQQIFHKALQRQGAEEE